LLCQFNDDSFPSKHFGVDGLRNSLGFDLQDHVIEHKISCLSLSVPALFCFLIATCFTESTAVSNVKGLVSI
jgi:hypothetical protein